MDDDILNPKSIFDVRERSNDSPRKMGRNETKQRILIQTKARGL